MVRNTVFLSKDSKVWNDFLTNDEKEINSYLLFSKTIKSKLIVTEQEDLFIIYIHLKYC